MQSDKDRPRNYPGEYNTDLIAQAALQYLEEASMINKPFFLGIAPIAPHSEWGAGATPKIFTAPQPAPRHKDLFPGITVPRTANFNPDVVGFLCTLEFVFSLISTSQALLVGYTT